MYRYVHISDVTFDALHDAFKAMPAHGRHENMKTFLISPLSFESSYESFSVSKSTIMLIGIYSA